MDILITSASRKVSLVRAFQRALAQEGGGKVLAVDVSPLSLAMYLADEHYLVPPSNRPEFLEQVLRLCKRLRIALLVPTRDEELPLFAEHRRRFAAVGTRVMVPDLNTVNICQDKKLFLNFCRKNRFSTPESYSRDDDGLPFPLFVKPRRGKGGQLAARVDSREELEFWLKQMAKQDTEVIIQELVEAPEYTLDLFADFSGKVISVVPRERVCIVSGESYVSRTSRNWALIRGGQRLAEKLGLLGHNTIQAFLCGKKVKFIEVNPRFGGAANLGFAAGAPTPLYLVKLLQGASLAPRLGKFANNYYMLRYTEDHFLEAGALSKRKLV